MKKPPRSSSIILLLFCFFYVFSPLTLRASSLVDCLVRFVHPDAVSVSRRIINNPHYPKLQDELKKLSEKERNKFPLLLWFEERINNGKVDEKIRWMKIKNPDELTTAQGFFKFYREVFLLYFQYSFGEKNSDPLFPFTLQYELGTIFNANPENINRFREDVKNHLGLINPSEGVSSSATQKYDLDIFTKGQEKFCKVIRSKTNGEATKK